MFVGKCRKYDNAQNKIHDKTTAFWLVELSDILMQYIAEKM